MTAKAKNRKRKHSEHIDEVSEGVPRKQQKKNKTLEKQNANKKELENKTPTENYEHDHYSEAEANAGSNDEEVQELENIPPLKPIEKEKPLRFPKDFKMMEFRNKLRGNDFLTELRHFLHLLEQKPRFADKYIEKRGKPLELAEALERIDKSNVLHIGYVCQALHTVLMEIVSNHPSHMESAVSAARYFLKTHSPVVEQLLESPLTKHRRIALKLLTAIVCVDPQMGRQVLSAFNILSDVRKITQLLSHTVHEFHEEETVRKCYIHFVLSFLVDGNTLLVQNILDRSSLIQALVFGLLYDDQLTVCLVLKTLKKYVLESANISKTKKIHVFNLECCKCFARLYDWFGPKVYFAKFAGKNLGGQAGGHISPEKIQSLVDAEEKKAVAMAVHEFLLTLLSSRKHGIAFDAITHFRQRHNAVQGKVIGFVPKPWNNTLKTELIVRTLEACPDLARQTIRHFANVIKPSRTGAKEWPHAANFLAILIGILHPKLLKPALVKLTLTDFAYWIKDICLPLETLMCIRDANLLLNEEFEMRLATHRLLLAMFLQYSNYLDAAMQREESKGSVGSTLRRFKFDLYNHILSHFPAVDLILRSLHATTSVSGAISTTSILEHFHVTLDLILAICKRNRAFIDKKGTILDYLKLIRPLYTGEVEDEDNNVGNEQHQLAKHGDIQLEIKAIKTILLLSPNAIRPGQKLFGNVLSSFIKGLVYGSGAEQQEACGLLREIFKNTGIFQAGLLEIDLWLEALRLSTSDTVDVVTQVMQQVLQVTDAEVDLPDDIELPSNENNLKQLFENIEKGYFVQAYVESFAISKLLPLIYKGVELVKPLRKYLELVCLLLFHYYPKPAYIVQLYERKFESQIPYMNGWLKQHFENEHQPPQLPKVATQVPQLRQLQSALLNASNESSFASIFGITNKESTEIVFEITINDKELRLSPIVQNERLLMTYIQQVIFVVAELTKKQQLQRPQAEFAAECLANFLTILKHQAEQNSEQLISYADDGSTLKEPSFLNSILRYIFDVRLSGIGSMHLCDAANSNYLYFLSILAGCCNTLPEFDSIVQNYRLKIVNAVAIGLESKEKIPAADFIQMVEAFGLSVENCLELLKLLCDNLKYNDLYVADVEASGYKRTFYLDFLNCVLRQLSKLEEAVGCESLMKPLAKFYIKMQENLNGELNLEEFEIALIDFFTVMHQFVPLIAKKVFSCIFGASRNSKASVKLAAHLLERHACELAPVFLELLPDHVTKRELIYPLLEIAFEHGFEIDASMLTAIYQEYRNGFMKSIEKPQKAGVIYKEHPSCSVALVVACMPETECLDFCKKRFQFNDSSELYQLYLMHAIYEKAFNASLKLPTDEESSMSNNAQAKMFVNFLHLHVQLLGNDLKRQTMSLEKLELFAYHIQRWCEQLPPLKFKPNFESLIKSQNWTNFCKSCLKLCMQSSESDEASEADYGLLLQLLAYLCDQLHEDFSCTENSNNADPEAASLFEMICTHSKFCEIMLAAKQNKLKTEVLHLLFVLAKKSPQEALPHLELPLLLGAYQAKLTAADRYAIALLQLYERYHTAVVQTYRPFVWGESAVACYALRENESNERNALTKQETTITLVMSLIERHQCEYTLENFPIWRKLDAAAQIPVVNFAKPSLKPFKCFGENQLQQYVESCFLRDSKGQLCSKPDPRQSPAAEEIYFQCYDPAFFIPLMSNCFAPGTVAHTARPVQNGMLAMCFAGLSSHDKEMRQAAGLVQLRYRAHFEQSKFFEKPLWIQAYDNIQAGLADLSEAWRAKHKTPSKQYVPVPRVPYIPALFVAKTFNITNDPTNLLYKHLTFYLRLKSAFNFQNVPEFNVLFHSPEVEHHTFRHFIIEVIRQGLKSSADLFLLVSTNTFKVLLGFYGGPMSNLETNLLLLSLFADCVKIPASAKLMIEHVGILPWLKTVIVSLEFFHFDVIERVIDIITQLWYAMSATSSDFYNYNFLCFELFGLMLNLLPVLSARINIGKFSRFLNVMQKTANIAKNSLPFNIVSSEQLDKLIACAQKHFGDLVKPLKNLKTFGPIGASTHEAYCTQLYAAQSEPDAIIALSSLRAFIIEWSKCQKTNLYESTLH